MQIDGLCFIEHLSFSAFNECNRFKISTFKHKTLFGECRQASADRIYATNENRRFCRKHSIFHNFDPKGPRPKDQRWAKEQQRLKDALNKDRATRLEGSFGNHKNHYGLGKVKARNEANERVWIYFGVFTANAVQMANQPATQRAA
ncbi:MAG: transposase [Bacteroidota bacterium]